MPLDHKIRIIGGFLKGRKLDVLNVDGLRPTTDRTRETLFNWLGESVVGARVLDLFAGSGTTAQAVMECNAQDGGHRNFILVQLPEPLKLSASAVRRAIRDGRMEDVRAQVPTTTWAFFQSEEGRAVAREIRRAGDVTHY